MEIKSELFDMSKYNGFDGEMEKVIQYSQGLVEDKNDKILPSAETVYYMFNFLLTNNYHIRKYLLHDYNDNLPSDNSTLHGRYLNTNSAFHSLNEAIDYYHFNTDLTIFQMAKSAAYYHYVFQKVLKEPSYDVVLHDNEFIVSYFNDLANYYLKSDVLKEAYRPYIEMLGKEVTSEYAYSYDHYIGKRAYNTYYIVKILRDVLIKNKDMIKNSLKNGNNLLFFSSNDLLNIYSIFNQFKIETGGLMFAQPSKVEQHFYLSKAPVFTLTLLQSDFDYDKWIDILNDILDQADVNLVNTPFNEVPNQLLTQFYYTTRNKFKDYQRILVDSYLGLYLVFKDDDEVFKKLDHFFMNCFDHSTSSFHYSKRNRTYDRFKKDVNKRFEELVKVYGKENVLKMPIGNYLSLDKTLDDIRDSVGFNRQKMLLILAQYANIFNTAMNAKKKEASH